MAKNKPSLAFLEALTQEKRRRGEEGPGGGFKTPEWFFNNPNAPQPSGTPAPPQPVRRPEPPGKKTFGLTRSQLIMAGVIAVLLLVVAYLAGRGQSAPRLTEPTEVVKQGPAVPSVMDVDSSPSIPPAAPELPMAQTPVAPAPSVPAGLSAAPESRIVGMNYVIIQSYPNESDAIEVAALLNRSGIGCTVERNHPFAPRWFVVIGTRAFARTSTPEYREYVRSLEQISARIPSRFRRFEPIAYRWR